MADGIDDTKGNDAQPKRVRGRPRNPLQPTSVESKKAVSDKVEQRIKSYSDDFDLSTLTTVDWQNIRNLAALEVAAEAINIQLAEYATGSKTLTPAEVKSLSDSIKVIMSEARQQAAALSIDRRTRMSGEQSDLEQYLPKLAQQAKELLYERAIAIVCLDCRKSEAQVDIRTGMLLYHLFEEDKEWNATFRCQREVCGKMFTVNHTNWKQYRMKAVDEIQPEMSDKEKEEE